MDRLSVRALLGKLPLTARVHQTGVNRAPGQKEDSDDATHERTLEAIACRVEPMGTHPAPPQTRTCAMNAYGSSGKAFCYPYRSAMGVW
jgi:hypothetical protein